MNFILASTSRTRAEILRSAGVPFIVASSDVDEESVKDSLLTAGSSPKHVAISLAEAKAVNVSKNHSSTLVLGADQVLQFGQELISKSLDMAAARMLLRRMRGQEHLLISALALALDGEAVWRHCSISRLVMRQFSDEFQDAYLSFEADSLLSGVGCYRLEGMGVQLFEKIEGDYFSILGLPLLPLLAELRQLGVIAP